MLCKPSQGTSNYLLHKGASLLPGSAPNITRKNTQNPAHRRYNSLSSRQRSNFHAAVVSGLINRKLTLPSVRKTSP